MRERPSWLGLIGKAQRLRACRVEELDSVGERQDPVGGRVVVEHAARCRHAGDVLDHGIDVAEEYRLAKLAATQRQCVVERRANVTQYDRRIERGEVDLDGDGEGDRQGLCRNVASVCASSPSSAPSAGTTTTSTRWARVPRLGRTNARACQMLA
jgi:hypothetical protein